MALAIFSQLSSEMSHFKAIERRSECGVRICSSHLSSRGIASAMKGPSPSPLVSLDLGHGHFWYNGVWVVWASGPGGGPLSLHDDIAVISTKHAETRREGRETSPQLSLQRRSRARIIHAMPVLGDGRGRGRGENHLGS